MNISRSEFPEQVTVIPTITLKSPDMKILRFVFYVPVTVICPILLLDPVTSKSILESSEPVTVPAVKTLPLPESMMLVREF